MLGCPVNGKILEFLGNENNSLLKPGTPIILFNFDTSVAYVNIFATSCMKKNIDSTAYNGQFPCQIRVDVSRVGWCLADDNYKWKGRMKAGSWLTKLEYMKWFDRVPWEESKWYQEQQEQLKMDGEKIETPERKKRN